MIFKIPIYIEIEGKIRPDRSQELHTWASQGFLKILKDLKMGDYHAQEFQGLKFKMRVVSPNQAMSRLGNPVKVPKEGPVNNVPRILPTLNR